MAPFGPILDSHHHLWQVARGDYAWMTPDLPIARDYMPGDLAPHLRQAGVSKTIVVQAAETEAETEFLLGLAERTEWIVGVCGWLDLEAKDFPARLSHFMANPYFKSVRPMLQDKDDPNWVLRPQVLENIRHIASVGGRLEILTRLPQLPAAIKAVAQVPGLRAVVNHLSKPDIASGNLEPWASQIARLRDYPDVYCKLSGMVTEADLLNWTPKDLHPYIAHAMDVFGIDRVMFGSDWPVALLAASGYGDVLNALRAVVGPHLDETGHRKLFHDNAARFYGV